MYGISFYFVMLTNDTVNYDFSTAVRIRMVTVMAAMMALLNCDPCKFKVR